MNSKRLTVAFDVDDTLLIPSVATGEGTDTPNHKTIAMFKWFQEQGAYMIIWSGGGVPYATRWAERLGLKPDEVRMKQRTTHIENECIDGKWIENEVADVDIAFDDCDVNLATVNVKVKRLNNGVSRKEWNQHD